jgi:hypothetical protein
MEIVNIVKTWLINKWNSERIFDKGTVVFIGIVAFFLLIKLISLIF